jgi:hypothetical protein
MYHFLRRNTEKSVGLKTIKQNEILIMALTSPNIKQMVAKEIPRLGSRSSEQILCLIT